MVSGPVIQGHADFGPLVTGVDVENAAMALMRRWFSTYLAELERRNNLAVGTLPRPKGWALAPSFDKWPEDQLPGVIVTSPGTLNPPQMGGDGVYAAWWQIEPGVVVSARTQAESHALAGIYGGALELLFLQRPSLDGFGAGGINWLGIRYDNLGYDDTRSLYAARLQFVIEHDEVASADMGPVTPDEPSDDAWPPWQEVLTVDIDVANYPPPAPLPEEDQ